ncbi:hypothetical protein [Micromonospora craniellae]|uniref:DUF3558 domain-containing protein n=1 Tax=Micromonospora craniellae TaxID=2294034 RepID=A0A372FXS9_9ACTN|nr:hypothetical protein [Micromonospora craniellae]QOC90067.1 hypothetical protein ID554_17835 [Micromonospora craniellae]RFS45269.1 hypothetical protein D0Q02_17755 [Micromonospora craniellae]
MIAQPWPRLVSLPVTALLVVALSGCASFGQRADPEMSSNRSATDQPGAGGAATSGEGRVSLLQNHGSDGPLRTLNVAPDGRWECINCAGDGVTSTGTLSEEHRERLQRLLTDPGLAEKTDEARGYRVTCVGALTSSLFTSAGLITSQDCPGEERPEVAEEILLLLTQNTPAKMVG